MARKGSLNLAKIVSSAGRIKTTAAQRDVVDIITFVEAEWGLGLPLYPVQRIILKAFYGIPLDDDPENAFEITDWRRENSRMHTEASYLRYLYDEGRSSIREVIPGDEKRQLILSVGRRSGKTLVSSCIAAYESYKLILKGNPQKYYGLSPSSSIQLISVATSKDQAGILYNEVSGHFAKCNFFHGYMANNTQSFAKFQTPHDIEQFGAYADNQKAKASIKVTFHACNAKGLRGAGNIVVILDEIAHFVEQGGSSAEEVYQSIAPSVGTFTPKNANKRPIHGPKTLTDGRIVMISSPLGRQGLFYVKFMQGMSGDESSSHTLCIQAPTWEVNPTISASVFIDSYNENPSIFFTEFGGEFTDRTLGFIEDRNDVLSCIDPHLRPRTRGLPHRPHFLGFDLGLVEDGSAVAITHIDDLGRIVLDFIGRMKAGEGDYADRERLDFEEVAEWLHVLSRRFRIHKGLFDQWGAIPLEQSLAKKGLVQLEGKQFSPQEHSAIWQNFKSMLWDRVGDKPRLVLYDITKEEKLAYEAKGEKPPEHLEYIEEVLSLQVTYKSKYVMEVAAPKVAGKHDDYADALARSVWLASMHLGKIKHIAGSRRNEQLGNGIRPSAQLQLQSRRNRLLGGSDPKRQIPQRGMSRTRRFARA